MAILGGERQENWVGYYKGGNELLPLFYLSCWVVYILKNNINMHESEPHIDKR